MTIQYIMLVSLGFLLASLITLLLAPIFWHRAVRLTNAKLRRSLPSSEQEILADKDQLRAKYAIRVHQLEKQVERASLGGARQKIDLNRRDASIGQLETDVSRLKSELEEHQNARGVLEQTLGDRLPKIEAKLEDARRLLVVRDGEIAELSQTSRRQQEALAEARVITQRQGGDIERLRSQTLAYEAQSRKGLADGDMEGALAIRAELEMLRTRSHDQASLIDRLLAEVAVNRVDAASASAEPAGATVVPIAGGGAKAGHAGGVTGGEQIPAEDLRREVAVLSKQLEQSRAATAASAPSQPNGEVESAGERELRAAKAQSEDQAAEITRLRTELAATALDASAEANGLSLRDNRLALKARVSGLEAKSNQQHETIQRLRAELAQSNERAARQSAGFMDEMRRLGVGAHALPPRNGTAADAGDTTRARNVARRAKAMFESSRAGPSNAQPPAEAGGASETSGTAPVAQSAASAPLIRRLVGANRPASPTTSDAHSPAPATKATAALVTTLHGNGIGTAAPPEPEAAMHSPRGPRLLDRLTATEGQG